MKLIQLAFYFLFFVGFLLVALQKQVLERLKKINFIIFKELNILRLIESLNIW